MKRRILATAAFAALLTTEARAGDNPLFMAIYQGPDAVRAALSNGASVNEKNAAGSTPLGMAVYGEDPEVLRILLANGADPNAKDNHGGTPLTGAVFADKAEHVQLLLDGGADIHIRGHQGMTPLASAVAAGKVEIVRLLIGKRADLNAKDDNGTPLIHYTLYGTASPEIFNLLVDGGADVNATTKAGQSLMSGAVFQGHADKARILIKRGAKLPAGPAEPLLRAIVLGDDAAAAKAVEAGAPVDDKGHQPIFYAAGLGRAAVVRLLLDKGVKADVTEATSGITPLYAAAGAGQFEAAKVLLERGADPNRSAKDAGEPVYAAAMRGQGKVLKLLLEKGGKLDLNKDRGYGVNTWDVIVTQAKGADTLRALKEAGVPIDVNRKNSHGQDALALSIVMGHADMIAFLIENGADVSQHFESLVQQGSLRGDPALIQIAADRGYRADGIQSTVALNFAKKLPAEKRHGVLKQLERVGVPLDEATRQEMSLPEVLAAEKAGDKALGSGNKADALLDYVKALGLAVPGSDAEQRVRKKAIDAARGFRPPLPEEVNRRTVRAQTFIEQAKSSEDFKKAVAELEQASNVAPWEAGVYYNLALVQEKAGDFGGSMRSLKWYLAADPAAKDAAAVKNRIYKLEAQQEMAGR